MNIAGQYQLITSQSLDQMAQGLNKIAGTNLKFEGTHQFVRDVQVFKQLNTDGYQKLGTFANAKNAQSYIEQANDAQLTQLNRKITGTGQEVDWVRFKEGKLSSLFEKSELIGGNAPGVDGATINRFTGEEISRTTVKAAQNNQGLGTNINDVLSALKKGTLDPKDVLVGIDGTESAFQDALEKNIDRAVMNGDIDYVNKLKQAREHLKVEELNNTASVKQSSARLQDKMAQGQAHSNVTLQEVSKKAMQGAVIGAAVGLTVSSLTNYMKYKNGQITEKEAFQEISQDTLKSSLIGGTLSTASIFLPAGPLGFVAGVAIGIYLNKTLTNVLDEVFGKGAYLEILHAAGFIAGMATSLEDSISKIAKDETTITTHTKTIRKKSKNIDQNFSEFDSIIKGDFE